MCLLTQRLYLYLYHSYIVNWQEIPFGLLMAVSTNSTLCSRRVGVCCLELLAGSFEKAGSLRCIATSLKITCPRTVSVCVCVVVSEVERGTQSWIFEDSFLYKCGQMEHYPGNKNGERDQSLYIVRFFLWLR